MKKLKKVHFILATWTFCGLRVTKVEHATYVRKDVTCKRCLRSIVTASTTNVEGMLRVKDESEKDASRVKQETHLW